MADQVTVRRALLADALAMAAIRVTQMAERGAPTEDAAFAQRFADWLFGAGAMRVHWVAEQAAQVVGFISITEYERMPLPQNDAGRWGYIGNFYVLPELRNMGVGKLLLDAAVAHSNELDFTRLVLSPSERSKSLYARAGFTSADMLLVLPLTASTR